MTDDIDQSGWAGILDPGERILWQGRPRPGLTFHDFQPMETAMGVFFMVFSVVWMSMAANIGSGMRNAPGFVSIFPLFGLLFFGIGFWTGFGRHLWASFLTSRTHYSLSDRRAFIAVDNPFGGRSLDDYPITPDSEIRLFDGSPGSVQFGTRSITSRYRRSGRGTIGGGRYRTVTRQKPILFHRIDDPRAVYRLMRDIQAGRTTGGTPEGADA